jgi:hypothetical protein
MFVCLVKYLEFDVVVIVAQEPKQSAVIWHLTTCLLVCQVLKQLCLFRR